MGLSRRAVTVMVATGAVVVITGAGVWVGFGLNTPAQPSPASDQSLSVAGTTTPATTDPLTTTDAPTTIVLPTTTQARPKAPVVPVHVMPAPVKPQPNIPLPPPVHNTAPAGCPPSHTGNPAARADVKSALVGAAGQNYWSGVRNPPLVNQNPPPANGAPDPSPNLGAPAVITVPATLMEAIAWQESGWDSDILSCDGGRGTMQIQNSTATWMNQRFGTSYDYTTLSGNAAIGGEYIEWLISYFGENSFDHHYDTSDQDMIVAVLDGYNAGPQNVQFANGHTVASHYAQTVAALMSQEPWNN